MNMRMAGMAGTIIQTRRTASVMKASSSQCLLYPWRGWHVRFVPKADSFAPLAWLAHKNNYLAYKAKILLAGWRLLFTAMTRSPLVVVRLARGVV